MQIEEVEKKSQACDFLAMPVRLYRGTPWVQPLDEDIEGIFSATANRFFKRGEVRRWLLRSNNRCIGRIAAFYDEKTATTSTNLQPTGGIGFFECEDSAPAAAQLFDTARDWLTRKGMQAMDGPIHFGERDKWWGLLVEGYDLPPNHQCYYHLPYYRSLFEGYGFKEYFRQYTYQGPRTHVLPQALRRRAARILENPKYRVEYRKKSEISRMTDDIMQVYNAAWRDRKDVIPVQRDDVLAMLKKVQSIMDEKLLWFAYYEDQAIGFYLSLPDINQLIAPLGGKLHFFNKLRLLYRLYTGVCNKAVGIIFGVVPRFQGLGVPDALIVAMAQVHQGSYDRYDYYEMNGIGNFNPNMQRVMDALGLQSVKVHSTYRKLFDEKQRYRTLLEAMNETKTKTAS